MKVVKLTREKEQYGDTACYYSPGTLDGLQEEIELSGIGDTFQMEIIEMSQEEYDKLPEFDGWC